MFDEVVALGASSSLSVSFMGISLMTFFRAPLLLSLLACLSLFACSAPAGGSCTQSSECAGQVCLISPDFPSGYCTQACTLGAPSSCPSSSVCIDDASGTPADAGIKSVCYQSCKVSTDCGSGYACREKAGQQVCMK